MHWVVDAVDGFDMRQISLALTAAVAVVVLGGAAAGLVSVGAVLATSASSDCATGGAVADATNNPGLVSDCEALLSARDTLAGSATLNWSADTPIADWEGVTVGGTPRRVTGLGLDNRQLTGTIPAELGSLSNLSLFVNRLSGEIPSELGSLSNLRVLHLGDNQLSGEIPSELGSLSDLEALHLWRNQLSGEIPPELGSLSNLEDLVPVPCVFDKYKK